MTPCNPDGPVRRRWLQLLVLLLPLACQPPEQQSVLSVDHVIAGPPSCAQCEITFEEIATLRSHDDPASASERAASVLCGIGEIYPQARDLPPRYRGIPWRTECGGSLFVWTRR